MPGLRKWDPAFGAAGNLVAASEIDEYRQYRVILPQVGGTNVGTVGPAGTGVGSPIGFLTLMADYPRNIAMSYVGTGTGGGGSATVNGRDQFGRLVTETIGLASGAGTAGTTAGTKVFARFIDGTFTYGTHLGPGTVGLQFGTTGTTALFGLPDKIAATTDVKSITLATALTGGSAQNNGTVGTAVLVGQHAFRAMTNVVGTTFYTVTYKSTYDSSQENNNAALAQVA